MQAQKLLILAAAVAIVVSNPTGVLREASPQASAMYQRSESGDDGQHGPRRPDGGAERRGSGGQGTPRAVPREEPRRPAPDAPRTSGRREAPDRVEPPRRYFAPPRTYYFPPIDVRLGFYYHPYFGFYYGPYYGPFYPYPGPFVHSSLYSTSATRLRVKPVEADVYVNGYYAGQVDDFDGIFQRLYVPAGHHTIEIRLDGYRPFMQKIYVAAGDTIEITQQLARLGSGETAPPRPRPEALPDEWTRPEAAAPTAQPASPYGVLAVRTEPADAQVLLDGEAWAGVGGQREFVIHLPAGWHRLEVRKAGYRTFATEIEMSEGRTTRLNVKLEP